jgi:hypothetical protein
MVVRRELVIEICIGLRQMGTPLGTPKVRSGVHRTGAGGAVSVPALEDVNRGDVR